jgi:hypothetical protein
MTTVFCGYFVSALWGRAHANSLVRALWPHTADAWHSGPTVTRRTIGATDASEPNFQRSWNLSKADRPHGPNYRAGSSKGEWNMKRLRYFALSVLVLSVVPASVGSARNFSTSDRFFLATFPNAEFLASFDTIRCNLTLEGTLHSRSFAKVVGSLIGYMTRAVATTVCASGSLTILTETLPWHMRYSGFEGTLPRIRRVFTHITGMAFRIREPFGITCLARSESGEPAIMRFIREESGVLQLAFLEGRISTGMECGGVQVTLFSLSNALTSPGGMRITVTLI